MSPIASVPVSESAISDADRLFATLDGASVSSEQGQWHSRVQGIHTDGPFIWLQLQRDDDDTRTAVLRLPRSITFDALMAVLRSIRFDGASPHIVRACG